MKKKIFSATILALSFIALPAMAQNCKQGTCPEGNTTACCTEGKAKAGNGCVNPFEGLNLTDAQKEKLKAIERPCRKAAERNRETRQQCSTERRNDRVKFLADIKAVLTPEQYVQFLENNFVNHRPGNHKARKSNCTNAKPCKKQCPESK